MIIEAVIKSLLEESRMNICLKVVYRSPSHLSFFFYYHKMLLLMRVICTRSHAHSEKVIKRGVTIINEADVKFMR